MSSKKYVKNPVEYNKAGHKRTYRVVTKEQLEGTEQDNGGAPVTFIDKTEFEKLCFIQCTLTEISAWFGCSEDTIERWCKETYGQRFADVYKRQAGKGLISLRRAQFRSAIERDNVAMQIWLGKNRLGQSDYGTSSDDENEKTEYDIREALYKEGVEKEVHGASEA